MRARALLAIAVVASAASTDCGGNQGLARGGFDEPSPPIGRAGIVRIDWHRRIADWTTIAYRPATRGGPAFDPVRHVVYVGSNDNGLYSLRSVDASVLWRFETLGRVDSTPVIDRDLVIFGSADGAVYALDAVTGRMRWRFATSAEVVHAPIVFNDTVYFVNANDIVMAISRADGTQRWRYRRTAPGGITLSGHAGLLRVAGRIYTGFSDGNVVALDAGDGSVAWEQDTSSDLENIEARNEAHEAIDVDTTPVVIGDIVYVASFTAGVYALDAVSGTRRWRRDDVLRVAGLGTDGHHLFAASATSGLVKLDPYDGTVLWARGLGGTVQGVVAVPGGILAVPMSERGMWFLRSTDGEPVDGLRPGSGFGSLPTVSGQQVFATSNGGEVYAMRVRPIQSDTVPAAIQ